PKRGMPRVGINAAEAEVARSHHQSSVINAVGAAGLTRRQAAETNNLAAAPQCGAVDRAVITIAVSDNLPGIVDADGYASGASRQDTEVDDSPATPKGSAG